MKKLLIIFSALFLFSCADDMNELNIDPKNPSSVPAEPLFSNGVRNIIDGMQSINVNNNVFRLYAQYHAQCTYPDESQYNMVGRKNPDNLWTIFYRDGLKDLDEAEKLLGASPASSVADVKARDNKIAITQTMKIYTYASLVDAFGNIPYSQALNGDNVTPAYDDAKTIYVDLINKLSVAINKMDSNYDGFSTADLIYGGDVSKWVKFANSLKLRLAMRIADVSSLATLSKQAAEEAAPNVFTSNADNCSMQYGSSSPNTNPIYQDLIASGRKDFVAADTFVDYLNSVNDPRRALWFKQVGGVYIGGVYGSANTYNSFSQLHDGVSTTTTFPLEDPTLAGTIMNYAEVCFLLAEAKERSYSVTGDAATHYANGVTASILEWGGSATDATTYLAQPSVDYATAAGTYKEKIGRQMWVSMFNQGLDGWSAWRKYDFGLLHAPAGMTLADIPRRMIYPIAEASVNAASYNAAKSAMGGDTAAIKVFWDVN